MSRDDNRPSSVKSDTGVQVLQKYNPPEGVGEAGTLLVQQQTLQRSQSISNVNNIQQQQQQQQQKTMATKQTNQNQVKTIQNISMTTTDSRNVVFSTNTQMAFNKNPNGQGPFIGAYIVNTVSTT